MLRLAGRAPMLFALAVASIVLAPTRSLAQDITTEANWEVDVHVGVVAPGFGGGTSTPLPSVESFTTVTGAPSAAVSSWFFGAGTALFNQVNAGIGAAIVPLDQALQDGITRRRGGINVGFTVARWLSPRLALEIQGDYAPSGVVMNDVTLASMESTATSYTEAWSATVRRWSGRRRLPVRSWRHWRGRTRRWSSVRFDGWPEGDRPQKTSVQELRRRWRWNLEHIDPSDKRHAQREPTDLPPTCLLLRALCGCRSLSATRCRSAQSSARAGHSSAPSMEGSSTTRILVAESGSTWPCC